MILFSNQLFQRIRQNSLAKDTKEKTALPILALVYFIKEISK